MTLSLQECVPQVENELSTRLQSRMSEEALRVKQKEALGTEQKGALKTVLADIRCREPFHVRSVNVDLPGGTVCAAAVRRCSSTE